jgi:osmotically-inducible protein OsmY
MRAEIETKVKAMKNVSEVINELNAAPLSSLSSRANDTFLTSKVKTSLIANENVPSNSMKIVTEAGKVYMLGIVTEAEANRAVDLARRASGVKQVVKLFDIISEADKKRLDAPPPK